MTQRANQYAAPIKWVSVILIALGRPGLQRLLLTAAGIVVVTGLANVTGGRDWGISTAFGLANAAEALTGEAVGARNREQFRKAVKASSLWALIFSALISLFYLAVGPLFIDLLTSIDTVRVAAREYLPWMVVLPMISVWSFQLDGIFIGSTWTAEMRNGMAMSLIAFVAALFMLVPGLGNHGLWLAFCLFMVARALTLGAVYPRLERAVGQ
mgnify:CR=1 FL=1